LILAGLVYSGERRLDSAGAQVPADIAIALRGQDHPWVSRGGLKLAHGLAHFGFDATNRVCLDIGASTGGFTDVLLAHGAAKVYAVDVGYGQFAHKLRIDPRVATLERTNARFLTAAEVPEPVGALVCDASFIGLRTVLPAGLALAASNAWLIALIKPQFEVGRGQVGKKGVVRDPELHRRVCDEIAAWLSTQTSWRVNGLTPSPITGPEGNVEFLIGAEKA
jgi:23S rRNA (cytidine1920-2'-O)/16S rRNA (cytidine1409-2'-O)-methyltransferase